MLTKLRHMHARELKMNPTKAQELSVKFLSKHCLNVWESFLLLIIEQA